MSNIQFIKNTNLQDPSVLQSAFRLRNETFKHRLGWEVSSHNGLEVDQFDEMNVSHIAMTDHNNEVIGYWRALPTTEPYMLSEIFPQLLRGEELPQGKEIWEISRFNVKKGSGNHSNKVISHICSSLVKSFYDFAIENGISSYVLVTTVACERILRLLGVETRRLGDGEAMMVGIERSVALWIDVGEHLNIRCN
ncbi:acyl-homoserine-lactone synthase [Vibrio sp. TRT 17S01]|uniref:acyl-homoserine-lactone synthase n=1 Tax=Vibrio sp. TRT 17S01 TaxID=3418505 RepID=UPI003CEB231C